jgi:hypothetical protein
VDIRGAFILRVLSLTLVFVSATLVACQAGTPAATTTPTATPSPTEVLDIEDINIEKDNFRGSMLSEEIVNVEPWAETENTILYAKALGALIRASQDFSIGSGTTYLISTLNMVDSSGNKQDLILGLVSYSLRQEITPTPDPQGNVFIPFSAMFFYTESDGLAFVPPGKGLDTAGGRMLRLGHWQEGDNIYLGFGAEGSGSTLAIFEITQAGKLVYHDPYSSLTKEVQTNQLPIDFGKVLFAIAPVLEVSVLPIEFINRIPPDKQYKFDNGQVIVDSQAWFKFDTATNAWVEESWQENLPGAFSEYAGSYVGGRLIGVKNAETGEILPALIAGDNVLFVNEKPKPIIYNPKLNQAKAEQTLSDVFTYFKAKLCADVKGVYISKVLETAINSPELNSLLAEGCTAKINADSDDFTSMDPRYAPYACNIPNQYFNIDEETPIIVRLVKEPTEYMWFGVGLDEYDQVSARGISISQQENGAIVISIYALRWGAPNDGPEFMLTWRLGTALQYLLGRSGPYPRNMDVVIGNTVSSYSGNYVPPLIMFGP